MSISSILSRLLNLKRCFKSTSSPFSCVCSSIISKSRLHRICSTAAIIASDIRKCAFSLSSSPLAFENSLDVKNEVRLCPFVGLGKNLQHYLLRDKFTKVVIILPGIHRQNTHPSILDERFFRFLPVILLTCQSC